MTLVALIICLLTAALGALGIASPSRLLGVVIIVIGGITPFFGLERFRRLLDWWSAQGSAFVRGWAVLALLFGLSLAYALVP